jgi:hypothetical protein
MQDEQGEHRPRPRAADLERHAVAEEGDLTEDPELERQAHLPSTARPVVDPRLPDCCRPAVSGTEGDVVTRSVTRTGADPPEGDKPMSKQMHRIRGLVVAAIFAVAVAAINVAPAFAGKYVP